MRPLLALTAAAVAGAIYVRRIYRLRDPVRLAPIEVGVLAPTDGRVVLVRRVDGGRVGADVPGGSLALADLLGVEPPQQDGWLLGIGVGALDVHYVYQPAGGTVSAVQMRQGGQNVPLGVPWARDRDPLGSRAVQANDRLTLQFSDPVQGAVTLTLIGPGGGLHATPYLKLGDPARAGFKAALLTEGGLALLHLPASLVPAVAVGERVRGAETVVAVE